MIAHSAGYIVAFMTPHKVVDDLMPVVRFWRGVTLINIHRWHRYIHTQNTIQPWNIKNIKINN